MHRPTLDPAASLALVVAVLAVSTSGPLVAFAAAAPALAIAFWRNALALGVLGPMSLIARRHEYAGLARREGLFCVLAGVALAVHFAAWMPSIRFTSVAASPAPSARETMAL